MAEYPNHQQVPFGDFVRSFDQQNNQQNGAGVDHHPAGPPPFGPFDDYGHPFAGAWGGPWGREYGHGHGHGPHGFGGRGGRGGGRGRHGRHNHDGEQEGEERTHSRTASPGGENVEGEDAAVSGEEGHEHGHGRRGPRGFGRGGRRCHGHGEHSGDEDAAAFGGEEHHGPRGFGGRRGGPHGHHRGGPQAGAWGHRGHAHGWGHHGRRGPPPFTGPARPFDLSGLFASLNAHPAVGGNPWAQIIRQVAEQAGIAQPQNEAQRSGETLFDADAEGTFVPPVDIFSTETAYILHIALPGAKKKDVGVNWDADKGELNIAGVVYRKGDEEFLKTLSTAERKVGMFERTVKLPPGSEEKEEVDEEGINAKLEDGVLVVTVPKVEKEWTEVKKVTIN